MATKEEKDKFSNTIIEIVSQEGSSCMEAIINYCEQNGLEVETAATLINPSLKAAIEDEAIRLRYLPKKRGVLDL